MGILENLYVGLINAFWCVIDRLYCLCFFCCYSK